MTRITRRRFVQQTAFAAALYGGPLTVFGGSRGLFDSNKQSRAPFDAEKIRNFGSRIAGRVITPEASEYDAARSIFNRAFDRHPAVIVRCGGSSDVARTLEFAQTEHLPLAVRAG